MSHQRSVGEYRGIDVTIWAVMLAVFEGLIGYAGLKMFPGEPYIVSVTPVVTALVMMRWGPWAAIHAVLGGAVYCFTAGGGLKQILIYCCGNLFALGALGLKKALGAEEIRQSAGKTLLFGLCTVLLMQLGRAALSLLMGVGTAGALLFFTADIITDLFTAAVILITRRLDGVFEDQRHYLIRQEEERRKEEGGYQ